MKELEKQLQQSSSEKEAKQKKEETSPVVFRNEQQKSLKPTREERQEVQEEVIENGLASEVEKALSNFQLSWDSHKKEDTVGKWTLVKSD